jgi:hypothetical protein
MKDIQLTNTYESGIETLSVHGGNISAELTIGHEAVSASWLFLLGREHAKQLRDWLTEWIKDGEDARGLIDELAEVCKVTEKTDVLP